ncbi:MAG: M28 family peptidase [Acidobacteriota bacterium]
MRVRFASLVLGAAVGIGGASWAGSAELPLPAGAREAAAAIDQATLRGHVRFLSDDLLEGRGPASRGDELARAYLASQLEILGLQPGVAGAWQQPFEIVGLTTHAPQRWVFRGPGGEASLRFLDDFIAVTGQQAASASLAGAELVFVGYGIQAPEFGWDDFKGVDLSGKVLVMLNDDPNWDPALFAGIRRLYYGRWSYKYESAARQGAAAAIIIHTTPSAGYPWQVVQTSWTGEQFELPAAGEPRLQVRSWVTEGAAREVVSLGGHKLDELVAAARERTFRPIPLGIQTSLALACDVRRAHTGNVAATLPGSDARLKDEVVVFCAHHDHLGRGRANANGDEIFNGALDNASGVAQVLAVARAFLRLPAAPRRSIMFLFPAGEEQGLIGSAYFAQHPPVAAERFAAVINFDAGNIFGRTRDIALVGKGKSSLDEVADAAAALQGRVVTDEHFPDRGAYYRSDQFSLARVGVPSLYFNTGVDFIGRPPGWGRQRLEAWLGANYHQPSDELTSEWDFAGLIEDTQLAFFAGLLVAQAEALPEWQPGDEFAAAREQALKKQ